MSKKPTPLDTSKLNATISAIKENVVGIPYPLWAVADGLSGPLDERLAEALRLLISGTVLIPFPKHVDGPEISSYAGACALIGVASQVHDLALREKTLLLAGEFLKTFGAQNVSQDVSAVA
jgi:hypothetical protein